MNFHDVQHPLDLYELFAANRENLLDVAWLAAAIEPHCKHKWIKHRGSRLRLIQHWNEFAQFLVLMAQHGPIRSYMEIGVSTGGTWLTADSYFRACWPGPHGFQRSYGIDRRDKLRDWKEYNAKFPTCEFRRQNSRRLRLKEERFDVCFIDAMHLEDWVLKDFEKTRRNCRFIAFHDIVWKNGSTVDLAWAKIKVQGVRHWEIIETSVPENCRFGIGVVEMGKQ